MESNIAARSSSMVVLKKGKRVVVLGWNRMAWRAPDKVLQHDSESKIKFFCVASITHRLIRKILVLSQNLWIIRVRGRYNMHRRPVWKLSVKIVKLLRLRDVVLIGWSLGGHILLSGAVLSRLSSDAGHSPQWEMPKAFNHLIGGFIEYVIGI